MSKSNPESYEYKPSKRDTRIMFFVLGFGTGLLALSGLKILQDEEQKPRENINVTREANLEIIKKQYMQFIYNIHTEILHEAIQMEDKVLCIKEADIINKIAPNHANIEDCNF